MVRVEIDLTPKGLEAVKHWKLFQLTRHWIILRRLHQYCGALGYSCCSGCDEDIDKAFSQD